MCTGQLSNFVCYLHPNHPELHGPSAPGPSELDQPSGTLQHLISHLRRNRPEPHQLFARNRLRRKPSEPHQQSAPEGSGNLSAICTGTLRNFISQLPRNCPEPHQPSAPEPSGTSSAICTGRLRNPPEPSPEPGVAAAPDRTRAFLGYRPHSKFCCWGKTAKACSMLKPFV